MATGHRRPLILDYPTTEALHAALPGLVLAHNLHGIDIDPRAVQIAALSLWMRAQKAFAAFNIDRKARPAIQKTNIVTAEPMPGEQDLLEQFTATLQPRFLGQLVERVFDRMKLAGEAGSLLRIEEEIREAIAEAKKQREAGPQHQAPLFAQDEAPRQMDLWEVADIPDDTFWEQAEEKIYQALRRFAESAKNGQAFSRRLFAEDAAQGFAFIDLCRKRYDVALMNPPFGDASMPSKPYIEEMFGDTKGDVYKTFVECFQDRLVYSGHLGIISSRTGFFLSQSTDWRQRVVLRLYRPTVLADLGHGVLDAMVETAAYILRSLSRQERKDLVLSLVPELTRVPKDQKGCFSIPKYQKAREGLKRHQAVAELEMLMAGGFLEEVPGGFRQFRPLPARIRSVAVPAPRPFSPMTCLRAVEAEDKEGAMREQVRSPSPDNQVYVVRPDSFADVPNAPFAYWVSDRVRRLFQTLPPFESEGRTAKQGLATADDFRFVRLWWEVPAGAFRKRWFPFAKGGEYSPYYADIHLVVNWEADGRELVAFDRSYIRNPEYYFRPGLTWPLRSQRGFSLRAMPQDCTFAHKGPACIIENDDRSRLAACICIMNSQIFNLLLSLQMAFGSYEVGVTQRTPMLHPDDFTTEKLSRTGRDAWKSKRRLDAASETSHAFGYPGVILQEYSALEDSVLAWNDLAIQEDKRFADIQKSVDELCFHLYGLSQEDVPLPFGTEHEEENEDTLDEDASLNTSEPWQLIASLVSWANGVAQGRFDPRSALDQTLDPEPPDPFSALPACSPGMLMRPDGLPAESGSIVSEEWLRARPDANTLPPNGSVAHPTITDSEYPVRIPWDGILVDDPGFEGGQLHDRDVVLRVREVLEVLWKDRASDIEQEACDILGVPDLRAWFRKSFFPDHIKRYSKSRRKAPIYWQLATPSASYSVWLYYHRFTRDTFYQVLNEYVAPKVRYEERELDNLRQQVGPNPSAGQRKELAAREAFVEELKTFREEVSRVAPLWNPNLNDGVIINFAPLWRLVPQHKPWQKECKACWDKLVKGDYDWAHLAMHLWPERVVPKCAKDRSLAIAHGLEDTFWEEDDKGKWAPKKVSGEAVQDLIAERTSPTVKAALDDLLKAPAPAGTATKRRKKKA
ncbi:MAG: Eco57I restriction-modification methylase domain-containing protein [Desulfatibacillaceae bacterium]